MTRGPDTHHQRFAQLTWHFNCHIATMAHPSWLKFEQQAQDPVWSAYLLARSGVDRSQDWYLRDAASRLWLIDATSLQTLLQAVFGVMQRPLLTRTVSKTRRDTLRAQWGPITWDAANDPLAPRLDLALDPSGDAITLGGSAGEQADAQRCAARTLVGLLGPSRLVIAQRARLRLPHSWRHDSPTALSESQRHALSDWIAHCWIPQRSAAWAWLF
jgi:hypothetical protein